MAGLTYKSLRYKWVYKEADKADLKKISASFRLPECVSEVLFKRGLKDTAVLNSYFETPLTGLSSPFLIKDMDKASERIAQAVAAGEKICVYGDYDVDGVTSVALMYHFLSEIKADVTYYIPNRLEEGYGLNTTAIEDIISRKAKLLITVDCGINAISEVEYAAERGLSVIVTDHHQPSETIPLAACAVVNPMREDDTSGAKCLSGVGVAFKVIMALRAKLNEMGVFEGKTPNIKKYLDLVTLGTVADVVPLVGENRIFVRHGLEIMSGRDCRAGLKELKRVAGVDGHRVSTANVGFGLAPRINAVGRLGNSDKGLRLLITSDRAQAKYLAEELDRENKERQEIEKDIIEESFAKVEENKLNEKYKGLVLYSREWHQGVIGIVASRLVEKYHMPAIVLTCEDGVGKGSGRSIPSFDLYKGLEKLQDILLSFGGHKYAAGLKIAESDIGDLQRRFHATVDELLSPEDFVAELNIDAFLEPEDVNGDFLKCLDKLEPYGAGNREPVFCIKGVKKFQPEAYVGKEGGHLKMFLEKHGRVFDCIGYNMRQYEKDVASSDSFDIVFTPSSGGYYTGRYMQLILKDIKKAEEPWRTTE